MTPTPHDFLLHLRIRRPALARRLDGIQGVERQRGGLIVRAPSDSWSRRELDARSAELGNEVRRFFGPNAGLELIAGPPSPEALPFPVLASKVWNHVAFLPGPEAGSVALVVRKPLYLDTWLPAAATGGDGAVALPAAPEAAWIGGNAIEDTPPRTPEDALCDLVESLCGVAREACSYVHMVAAFPGDDVADRLEARLYAIKEWGTPRVPAAILQKYVGRLHYVDPLRPVLGLRLADPSHRPPGPTSFP